MNNTSCESAQCDFLPGVHPHEILTRSQYLMANFILTCFIMPVIIVIGLPTNIINCVVFWRQGLGDRMNVCLFALSLVDLSMVSVPTLYSIAYYTEQSDPVTNAGLSWYFQVYLSGVGHGFRTASGFITIVIAVERCLCVTFPLKAASLISTRTMATTVLLIAVLTQVAFLTIPMTMRVEVVQVSNSTIIGIGDSDFYRENQVFFTIFENMIMLNVVPLATFIIICVCTALTVVKLRAAMTWRKTTSCSSEGGQGQHTALTKMLVLVCCVYILTAIPWLIFYLVFLTWHDSFFEEEYYYLNATLYAAIFYCPYINSSMGFFVYVNRSTRFRKDVFSMFNTCCKVQLTGEKNTLCRTLGDI